MYISDSTLLERLGGFNIVDLGGGRVWLCGAGELHADWFQVAGQWGTREGSGTSGATDTVSQEMRWQLQLLHHRSIWSQEMMLLYSSPTEIFYENIVYDGELFTWGMLESRCSLLASSLALHSRQLQIYVLACIYSVKMCIYILVDLASHTFSSWRYNIAS